MRLVQPAYQLSLNDDSLITGPAACLADGEAFYARDRCGEAEPMGFGVHGQYLRIDLSAGHGEVVPCRSRSFAHFLGGVGLGAWLLAHESPAGADPLGPEAALAFVFSPLVGSPLTTSAKFAVAAISPLTGRFCDALSSSHFALSGKRTGCDAIVLTGRTHGPSIVFVDGVGGESVRVEVVAADELWGLSAREAERRIRASHGPEWQVAAIGPAGERGIPFATISHDGRHAGRGGLGAVMGAKGVKAVAVRGDQPNPAGRPQRGRSRSPGTCPHGRSARPPRSTASSARWPISWSSTASRPCPTRNFQAGRFEGAENLSDEDLGPARRLAKNSCAFVHDRLRTRLCPQAAAGPDAGGRGPDGVREPLRPGLVVRGRRPGGRPPRGRPLRRVMGSTRSRPAARSPS